MLRSSTTLRELLSGINAGRQRLAQQFSTMEGWQSQQNVRFDNYVKEKRRRQRFDAFDQRVERAYRVAASQHKAEVLNAVKRRLKSSNEKFTAAAMLELKKATEERLLWLREVWSQIDADYRSQDPARQSIAAEEISAALRGEPGEYMKWVYELKREERFMGPKGKAALQAELSGADLPEVDDEEVNRYHSLKLSMLDIERSVKTKFGVAGQQHWAELQAAKDDLYERKLDQAAEVYKQLLDQSGRYDESRRTALLRSSVERVHEAQVRFKAAMELESEREKLMEAHQAMEEERKRVAKEERIALLQEAAELRAKGMASDEITARMRERQLERHARRQAEYQLKEQEAVQAKKERYLRLIDQFKTDVEEREGNELLWQGQHDRAGDDSATSLRLQRAPQQSHARRGLSAFGFAEDDRLEGGADATALTTLESQQRSALSAEDAYRGMSKEDERLTSASSSTALGEQARSASPHAHKALHNELWKAIKADTYEDPFHTVHQARLDAAKTHDPLYARTFPTNLVLGRKYERQNLGEMAAGGDMSGEVLQKGAAVQKHFHWGLSSATVHDIDSDGAKNYFFDGNWHVRDEKTGDIDWKHERRVGGVAFRGPRFYRIGAERDARNPAERVVDPTPSSSSVATAPYTPYGGRQQQDQVWDRSPLEAMTQRQSTTGGRGERGPVPSWRSG